MPRRKITTKIENGKVVFSKEILEYFENIRTEENDIFINKYFEVLSDENNLIATKYHKHHIIPCCTFKSENCTTRKESEFLADNINGNVIKLSISNHLLAHYWLWKIFKNKDLKCAFRKMSATNKYIEDLSENEIKEIAKLNEECAKENQTKEEMAQHNKQWREEHKEELKQKSKEKYQRDKEKNIEKNKKYYEEHKEEIAKQRKEYAQINKEKISKYLKEYRKEYDKTHEKENKQRHKKYYEDNKDVLLKKNKEYNKEHKEDIKKYQEKYKEEHEDEIKQYYKERYANNREEILKKENEQNHQQCYDPKENNFCTYVALKTRKYRNKEKYKNVNPKDCIIK